MDGAAPTPVKVHVSLWQLLAAFALGVVLFGGGVLVGRLTGDETEATIGDLSATVPQGTDGGDASLAAADASEGGAADASEGGAADSGPQGITVEGLVAALATIDHQRLTFEHGTDQLTADGAAVAAEIAAVLVANPFIPVEVEIHTYTEATPGENHGLSVLQAEAVVSALAANGVDPARLTAVGLGGSSEQPEGIVELVRFASNDSGVDRLLGAVDFLAITFDGNGDLTDGNAVLGEVVDIMATNPSATLDLVGYAYLGDSDASHDRSHTVTDTVVELLGAGGLGRQRIDVVGLGDTPTQVEGTTDVELEVGSPAALTLALRAVDTSRIQFVPGTGDPTADGASALIEVATALELDPTQRIEISAHAYGAPTSAENHVLSHVQGDGVVEALADLGIDPARLEVESHGDPIAFRRGNRASYISFYPLD